MRAAAHLHLHGLHAQFFHDLIPEPSAKPKLCKMQHMLTCLILYTQTLQDVVMVVYTVSYPPRLIPVSLVLPSLDDALGNAPGPAPQAAPAAPSLNQVVKVLP